MTEETPEHMISREMMFGDKYVAPSEVGALFDRWRGEGSTPAAAAGCFDLLHVGCVRFAASAASKGDKFLMAVYDDQSVEEIRGPGRPVMPLRHRLDMVAALETVDAVTHVDLNTVAQLASSLDGSFVYERHFHPKERAGDGDAGDSNFDTCADWLIKTIREKHRAQADTQNG